MLRGLRRGIGLFLILLGGFIVGSNLWVWSAGWNRLASDPSEVPAGSVMVVLGTVEFVQGSRERTGTYQPRIEAATQLAKSGRIRLVITSGTEVHARDMAAQLRAAGVTCPIFEDPYGLRTLDSVVRAKASHPQDHVVFVSQGWHCVRALWLADHEGLRASAYPAAFGDGWRPVMGAWRDCLAKPKAVLDRCVGNPLTTAVPPGEGNVPHR